MQSLEADLADIPRWYDSIWLAKYIQARAVLGRVAPARLAAFEDAMAVLRTNPAFSVKTVRGLFDAADLDRIRAEVAAIPRDHLELHELQAFGRFVVHDWPEFTRLQAEMTDRVSELSGEAVEPSYNFLSLYTHRGDCEPHLDTPSAKWTLDICIEQDEVWPIHVSDVVSWPGSMAEAKDAAGMVRTDESLNFRPYLLEPGDAMLFAGSSQWHYREPMPARGRGAHCNLLFFHFRPKGSAELIQPANWARLFDVPELAAIPGIEAPH